MAYRKDRYIPSPSTIVTNAAVYDGPPDTEEDRLTFDRLHRVANWIQDQTDRQPLYTNPFVNQSQPALAQAVPQS